MMPKVINETNVVLLPKVEVPAIMRDLRPISLCNVLYRVVSKVLGNRLQYLLPRIISVEQSAFVKRRSIVDNVMVAFELIHHMETKHNAKTGDATLKIDISKAYDRVDWGYLEAILLRLGFDRRWVDLMMMCLTSVEYTVLVNSSKVGPIVPGRGLRQRCRLSPFLFILCAEGLSALLRKELGKGRLHEVRVCRWAPTVSHFLFADDSFFFFRRM